MAPPQRLRHMLTSMRVADFVYYNIPNPDSFNSNIVASRPSVPWGLLDAEGSDSLTLSLEDCQFFKANGFLLKKRCLLDGLQCAAARTYLWSRAPPFLRADNPDSWLDPQQRWLATEPHVHVESTFEADSATWKLHDCGDQPWMLRLFGANKRVLRHVEGLIGGPLRAPTRTRGIYAVFPSTKHRNLSEQALGAALDPHNDVSAQVLNGTAYLNDVGARAGGLTVWPGSHRLLYFANFHEYNPGRDPHVFQQLLDRVKATITPLDICAPAGSVIFWHGRLAHSPGIHRGAPGSEPRLAVPTDWQKQRVNGAHPEWFKDAPLYKDQGRPPQQDCFVDWALEPYS